MLQGAIFPEHGASPPADTYAMLRNLTAHQQNAAAFLVVVFGVFGQVLHPTMWHAALLNSVYRISSLFRLTDKSKALLLLLPPRSNSWAGLRSESG